LNLQNNYPARGKSGIVDSQATSTASGFAAIDNTKWVLQYAALGFCNANASATIGMFETTASGSFSETGVFFQTLVTTTSGLLYIDLGDVGIQASDSGSRMGVFVGSCTLSWTLLTSGYYTE
jgi:hypothetical protein